MKMLYTANGRYIRCCTEGCPGVPLQSRGHHSGGKPLSAAADYA